MSTPEPTRPRPAALLGDTPPGEARARFQLSAPAGDAAAAPGERRVTVMAWLDDLLCEAARGRFGDGRPVATLDLHLSFMVDPAPGPLDGQARVIGGGRSISFCEAQLRDAAGRTVAQALGTCRHAEPPARPDADPDAIDLRSSR